MVFKRSVTMIIVALFMAIIVVLTLQNASVVKIRLLFWDFESSLALVIFIAFILGIIVTSIFLLSTQLHSRATKEEKLKEEETSSQSE